MYNSSTCCHLCTGGESRVHSCVPSYPFRITAALRNRARKINEERTKKESCADFPRASTQPASQPTSQPAQPSISASLPSRCSFAPRRVSRHFPLLRGHHFRRGCPGRNPTVALRLAAVPAQRLPHLGRGEPRKERPLPLPRDERHRTGAEPSGQLHGEGPAAHRLGGIVVVGVVGGARECSH